MGFKTFDWNAGGEDADADGDLDKPATSGQFVQKILREAKGQANLVVLMHDTMRFRSL